MALFSPLAVPSRRVLSTIDVGAALKECAMPAPDPSDLAVLVIEDNPDTRLIVRELLKHECGVRHYLEVSAGWQAFKQLREQSTPHPIDLILLDLHIPGEDGYGVLTRIRSTATLL